MKKEILGMKKDGTHYARVTRRCVAILANVNANKTYNFTELADALEAASLPEFFLARFERSASAARIREYLRYLVDLEAFELTDNAYSVNFPKGANDGQWTQRLADRASRHLGKILNEKPAQIFDLIDQKRKELHGQNKIPTISAIVAKLELKTAREEEVTRWSLFVYADGGASKWRIRRYPALTLH